MAEALHPGGSIIHGEREEQGSIALDQWRGLALSFVLVSHGFFYTNRVNGIGRVGVNLFFFISGILVFRSLSRSKARTPRLRTTSFWLRRLRRLYPAVLGYVIAMTPIVWLLQDMPNLVNGRFDQYLRTIPPALSYLMNYFDGAYSLGHLWSLACEGQFYLIAPLFFWLAGSKDSRRNGVYGLILAVLVLLGAAQPFFHEGKYHFEFAVWPMMVGFVSEYKREALKRLLRPWAGILLWLGTGICFAGFLVTIFLRDSKVIAIAMGAVLLAPCFVAYAFGRPMTGWTGRATRWLGERTYSIYLWQQPLTLCGYLPPFLHPAGALLSVGAGAVWFNLLERPFLSSNRRDAEDRHKQKGGVTFVSVSVGAGFLALVAAVIFFGARKNYESALRARIWPSDVEPATVKSNFSGSNAPVLLLLGDSRIAEWGLPNLTNWTIINAGVSGATTAEVNARAKTLLSKFHPDTVVIEAGINDLKYLGLKKEREAEITSLVISNLASVVHQCAQQHARVVLLKIWPAGPVTFPRTLVWRQAVTTAIDKVNEGMSQLAAPDVLVSDIGSTLVLTGKSSYRDTLHLKAQAYEKLDDDLRILLSQKR